MGAAVPTTVEVLDIPTRSALELGVNAPLQTRLMVFASTRTTTSILENAVHHSVGHLMVVAAIQVAAMTLNLAAKFVLPVTQCHWRRCLPMPHGVNWLVATSSRLDGSSTQCLLAESVT